MTFLYLKMGSCQSYNLSPGAQYPSYVAACISKYFFEISCLIFCSSSRTIHINIIEFAIRPIESQIFATWPFPKKSFFVPPVTRYKKHIFQNKKKSFKISNYTKHTTHPTKNKTIANGAKISNSKTSLGFRPQNPRSDR